MGVNTVYLLFIVGMLFIFSFVRNSTFIVPRTNKFYSMAIWINVLNYIAYMMRPVFERYHLVILANIDEIVIYAGSPMIAFFLLFCTCKKNGLIYKAVCICQLVFSIICVGSCFTGWMFVVDSNAVYSRGPLNPFAFGYSVLLELAWVICLLIEYKTATAKEKIKIVSIAVIEGVAISFQLWDSTIKTSLLGSSFLLILFYIFLIEIEGQYDKLTKVFNLRAYSVATTGLSNNYSIIVFDINGLKGVNDTLGHDEGDRLIKGIADSIQACGLESTSVYRIGGDEFVMIVKSVSNEILDRITSNIKENYSKLEKELGYEVSTSIGVAVNTTGMEYDKLFRIADSNMYDDKREYYSRTGKDRRVSPIRMIEK